MGFWIRNCIVTADPDPEGGNQPPKRRKIKYEEKQKI
jgi:hypothetical protein